MNNTDSMNTLEPGEFELRKAFENTTTNNVRTIIDYSTQTRELIRKTMEEVLELKKMIVAKDTEVMQLRQQVSLLQAKIYKGGT